MSALMQPSPQVAPAVVKLLRMRWMISFNGFKHAKRKNQVGILFATFGILCFAGFIFWLSWLMLGFLRSPLLMQYAGIDAAPFLKVVPSLVLTVLFLGILLTSFGVLLQALYLSGDMDFLLAAPVPIRAVFASKLLQAILPSFGIASLFGLPVLLGLGFSGGYNLLYYPLVILTMVLLTLAAAGMAALMVMAVVRVVPARRVAEVLGFLGAISGFICSQTGNLFNLSRGGFDPTSAQANGVFNLLARASTPWLPINWAGRGLVEIGEGNLWFGLGLTLLVVGVSAIIFWVTLVLAERWYYTGWAGMQVISNRKKALVRTRVSDAQPWAGRILPAPVWGLVRKDFLVLRRDLRNLSQLVTPLIFGIMYSFMLLRNNNQFPAGQGEAPAWFMDSLNAMMAFSSVGMALFVGWMLLGQLAGNGISREGKNYWVLKASPLNPWHLLSAKFIVAYLPALVLGTFFLVMISLLRGFEAGGFLFGLLTISMCLAGMTGILVGFGTAGANFTWEDPRKMNAGNMGCLGSIVNLLFMMVALGVFIAPVMLATVFNMPPVYGYLAGGALGTVLCLVVGYLPLRMASGKVSMLNE